MDAAPPPPHQAPAPLSPSAPYVYAATDVRPVGPREIELCEKASQTDWVYLGALAALDVASVWFDNSVKFNGSEPLLLAGAGSVGLAWGLTLGGGYLALPKCSPDWVSAAPREGDVRTSWQFVTAIAVLAGVTAPLIVGTEIGAIPGVTAPDHMGWSMQVRQWRVALAAAGGFGGALVPLVLPPRTWSAARELGRLRIAPTADGKGGFVTVGGVF